MLMKKNNTLSIILIGLLGIIVVSLVGLGIYVKKFYDNIILKFKIDKSKINLKDIVIGLLANKSLILPVQIIIDNKNNKALKLENVEVRVNYLGVDVLQTIKGSIPLILVHANSFGNTFNTLVNIIPNASAISLISEVINNNHPSIKITITATILGVNRSFSFNYNIE